ncbi:MAG: tyrosine-type recombinase/integrase [Gemmata sp.]
MGRPAKVWYRADIGWWMITLGGEKTRLVQGPNDDDHRELAEEKYVELRKLRRLSPEAVVSRTADVVEAFLLHSRLNHAADTYRGHKYYCQLFAEHCGQVLARDLKPHHVTAWVTAMQSEKRVLAGRAEKDRLREELPVGERHKAGGNPRRWGPTSVYNARKTAYTVFSWAAKEKLLPNNPLVGMPRPKPQPRQRAITDDEFHKLHDNAGGPLQDVLTALYHTGARPKEIRDLVWEHVRDDRWVLPQHKTAKTTGKPRVIFLNEQMRAMMERLKGNGSTHVFLNTEDKPWTQGALQQQVWRIKTKLGLADDLCAYLCRQPREFCVIQAAWDCIPIDTHPHVVGEFDGQSGRHPPGPRGYVEKFPLHVPEPRRLFGTVSGPRLGPRRQLAEVGADLPQDVQAQVDVELA